MKAIWRFELPIVDCPVVDMPRGARVLNGPPSGRGDPDRIEIWAEVDVQEEAAPRAFRVVGTGGPMPGDCGRFVGTVLTHDGVYVWHLYEACESA